jgi:Carboxypeptidase regulatory-like domain/TonB-dependent Receptor Plug Domain
MVKKLITSIALVAVLAGLSTLGFAQGTESAVKGNLSIIATDPSGAVVQGAKVQITGPTGDRTADTDAEGKSNFQALVPGMYSVKISKDGFKTSEVKQVEVQTGRTSAVPVKLELGTSTTTVEVSAAGVAVDTTSTAVASNLTDTFYEAVPVARNVTGLFYAAPGVTSGGGTGTANPSIAGGTGLENNYVADGVSITDGGFGGIGVYSRNYGSLSTGINLSFVKEVQVKTGGFEAQYGKSTGGIVQIVTKSGSNKFHGSVGGFFAPQQLEGTRLFTDDFAAGTQNTLFNRQGKILHQSNYDVDVEVGGYVPKFKDHLFFFGSFNPQWNTDHDQFAQFLNPSDLLNGSPTQTSLGNRDVSSKVYSYAGKGTYRLNDHHQFEVSYFGDPTYGSFDPHGNAGLVTASGSTFDKLQYGTRNLVGRYNGTLSATWLLNASFTWGHNNLTDTPSAAAQPAFSIQDQTQRNPCFEPAGSPLFNPACTASTNPQRGIYQRQGLGYYENTHGDTYGLNFDTQKTFSFMGEHNLSFGYRYDRSHYDGAKAYTGARIPIDPATAAIAGAPSPAVLNALIQNGTTASFYLRTSAGFCGISDMVIPGQNGCGDGTTGVRLIQVRGEFGNLNFKTESLYHTLFAQDSWSPSKFVTLNAGIRWEQQHVNGVNAGYTFNDNWSPRLGISVDPWGDRKTKVTANFGRYTESLPLDIAIRSLSAEYDFPTTIWAAPNDGKGNVALNPDGTLNFSNFNVANNFAGFAGGISAQSAVAFGKGTRSEYLDEYQLGFEHEFSNSGVVFSARYTDRRIKRIIEDNAALSPEAYQAGLSQTYFISNPNKNQDLFQNPVQIDYVLGARPASCGDPNNKQNIIDAQATDSNGNPVTNANGDNAFCIKHAFDANGFTIQGLAGPDGKPDGFVDPVRKYQAFEVEVNKSMSRGWQLRANYRIAKLQGNYEGSFRNDNGQSDPNISSLFDFTRGDFNLLGQQFVPGVLNTDVRHLANGFVSYTFSKNHISGLTMGSSVHFQTGIPINNLFAHPAYQNAGEIPFCADNTTNCTSARGALGRTKDWGSVDYHADYPIRITEGTRLRVGADLFNIANSKTQLRVNQFAQRSFAVPNADFQKPTGIGPSGVYGNTNPAYQRPFYARFSVKYEF